MIESSSLKADDPTAQILEVESIEFPGLVYFPWVKKHEKYGKTVEGNDDILLIKTVDKISPKIIENEFVVNSICLSEPNYKPSGIARIAGWGFQGINRDIIQDLIVVDNPVISNEEADKVIKGTPHHYGNGGQYYVYNISLSEKELCSMASHNPGLMGRSDPLEFNGRVILITSSALKLHFR